MLVAARPRALASGQIAASRYRREVNPVRTAMERVLSGTRPRNSPKYVCKIEMRWWVRTRTTVLNLRAAVTAEIVSAKATDLPLDLRGLSQSQSPQRRHSATLVGEKPVINNPINQESTGLTGYASAHPRVGKPTKFASPSLLRLEYAASAACWTR